MNITVFGGAQPQTGTPAYQEAYLLGKILAGAGHTVLTGGYMGTMEAISRGAAEAGGRFGREQARAARHDLGNGQGRTDVGREDG